MSAASINREILVNTIKGDFLNGTSIADSMLENTYPTLSAEQRADIIKSIQYAMCVDVSNEVHLVVTAPPSFSIKARSTMSVMDSMIRNAERNILMTGYSMSAHFSDLVDAVVEKSKKGVFVKFFVNDIDQQAHFDKISRNTGRFLKVYNYRAAKDKIATLHAKVISVDQEKTLITSANLSYHGLQGNIELGVLIHSKQVAKQIDDIFTKLIFSKVFREV